MRWLIPIALFIFGVLVTNMTVIPAQGDPDVAGGGLMIISLIWLAILVILRLRRG